MTFGLETDWTYSTACGQHATTNITAYPTVAK